ncbi:alpha/beta fold hydrolase [Tropicibacter naphthalenivorans]|uniref:AB hydrolase superfamily protein YdjP n=1 Tax=Tropicibacter naphthalenivorans TaxID=441103 RepID=A0A0P1GPJ7_9RHOB|nr:alpha/beta fold hydrolase [Tropicibacter naphthalenivorans]CUH76064.1 AB hydrolase superfamily protein YdjP [Tropicibacter naphthalenivorans]SMC40241.1 Pimeloyl-ACP methyl ester carboxylesterase [Tropicibacter naphthalenivorans]
MREPVVFLPGLMCDARLFGPQIADLSRDHAVMVAPISQGERIEEIASSVLDVLPKRCALAGWGLGGVVAMEIIRRAPDRVTRLALLSTSPLAETPQQAAERDPRIIRVRAGKFDDVMREEYHIDLLPPGPYRSEILELIYDMARGQGPECYVRQCRALQRRRDQQGTLRRIAVPTLILCGEDDVRYPVKRHSFMAELIPGAQLQVIGGAGHFPMLEAADATSDALRAWMKQPLVLR